MGSTASTWQQSKQKFSKTLAFPLVLIDLFSNNSLRYSPSCLSELVSFVRERGEEMAAVMDAAAAAAAAEGTRAASPGSRLGKRLSLHVY